MFTLNVNIECLHRMFTLDAELSIFISRYIFYFNCGSLRHIMAVKMLHLGGQDVTFGRSRCYIWAVKILHLGSQDVTFGQLRWGVKMLHLGS